MAQEYCVAYGILPDEEAAKIHKVGMHAGVVSSGGGRMLRLIDPTH